MMFRDRFQQYFIKVSLNVYKMNQQSLAVLISSYSYQINKFLNISLLWHWSYFSIKKISLSGFINKKL